MNTYTFCDGQTAHPVKAPTLLRACSDYATRYSTDPIKPAGTLFTVMVYAGEDTDADSIATLVMDTNGKGGVSAWKLIHNKTE